MDYMYQYVFELHLWMLCIEKGVILVFHESSCISTDCKRNVLLVSLQTRGNTCAFLKKELFMPNRHFHCQLKKGPEMCITIVFSTFSHYHKELSRSFFSSLKPFMFGNHEFTTPLYLSSCHKNELLQILCTSPPIIIAAAKSMPIFHKKGHPRKKKSSEALKRRVVHLEIL